MAQRKPLTPQALKLKELVESFGGPAKFAANFSKNDADKPIDPTYISQILNGHRGFRDVAMKNMAARAGLPENYFEVEQIPTGPQPRIEQPPALYQLSSANSLEIRIIDVLRQLPEDRQREVLTFAEERLTLHRAGHQNSTLRTGS